MPATLHIGLAALTGAMILQAGPAQAAAFNLIRARADEATVIDPAAIEIVPGGALRRAVSVTVKRSLVTGGPAQPGYVRTLNEYDCGQWRMRWRTFTVYSRFGAKVMSQVNAEQAWAPASFESDASLRIVCNGASGDAAVAAPSLGQLVLALMSAWDAEPPKPPPVKPPVAAKPTPR